MKRTLLLIFCILGFSHSAFASVAFVATASSSAGNGSTSIASFNIDLGSAANRCVGVGLSFGDGGLATLVAVTVGGESLTEVTGSKSAASFSGYSTLFAKATTLTGTQAVLVTWTGLTSAVAGVNSVSGCDQTTPMNNGNNGEGSTSTPSIAITSISGDLTMSVVCDISGFAPSSTNQTIEWTVVVLGSVVGGGGDIGAGGGTTTHTWTLSGSHTNSTSGANFKAAAAGGTTHLQLLTLGAGD